MHRPSALMMWPDSAAPSLGSNQVKGLIEAAEAKLARTKSQIQHLVRLCDDEREIIATLKPLIAPIRKLSAEFLVEIFQILVDSAEPKDRKLVDLIVDSEGPTNGWLTQVLVISQVCRKWKGLACTTPQLWNRRLDMTLQRRWDEHDESIAKTFLERSAPLPIPITLDYERSEPTPLTDYIYSQAPRWKSLFFRYSQISGLRELPMDALKSLEDLYLKTDTEDPSSPVEVFLRAPRLRTVTLDVLNVKSFPMPWSQLTNLTLCDCEESAQILSDILRRCTNLVSLDLSGIESWSQPGPSPVHMIRLVRLETLIVSFRGAVKFGVELATCIAPFFARLNLPELTVLKIKSCKWAPLGPPADIEGFLRRSRKIEQLSITGPTFTFVFCICVLMESPNLLELTLNSRFSQGAFDSVLRLLRYDYDKNTAHPVPRLRRLRLVNDNSTGEKVSKSLLEKTIVSRWWTDEELRALPVPPAVARWEHIWISNLSGYLEEEVDDDDFSEEIAELREQGLEVDIE